MKKIHAGSDWIAFSLSLALGAFLNTSTPTLANDQVLRIPCGKGFMRPCTNAERGPASISSKKSVIQEQAVIPKLVHNVRTYLKDHAAFLYNDGKDAQGNPKRFESGKAVNLQTGEYQDFGFPTCSRCRTAFNHFNKETGTNYKGDACGRTKTTVRITSNGSKFINLSEDAEAYYRGAYTMVLNHMMNRILADAKNTHAIVYSPGCKAMALKANQLMHDSRGPIEQIKALLGKTGAKEKEMSEKDFDEFLSEHAPNDDSNSILGINKKTLDERPDQGRLRQLAQQLKSMILNTEALVGEVVLCTISDRTGVEFRKNFGQWQEFFNANSMQYLESQVEAHVVRECGHLFKYTTMGKAVDCSNRAANQIVPKIVEDFFDRKIAGYCEDHITSEREG